VRTSRSAPAWSAPINAASEVRSCPVAVGTVPGFPTKTNRVTAPSLSPIFVATVDNPYVSAVIGAAIAASNSFFARACAAAAVDDVMMISAFY